MPSSDPRPKPALETFIHEFYKEMVERAETREVDGKEFLVYEGHYSRLFNRVVGNTVYYTSIRKILLETGSITVLRIGNRAQPTTLILNHPPPPQDEWPQDLTGEQVSATMRAEFERRIAALEVWRETTTGGGKVNLVEVLRNFEGRIAELERLGQLAKKEGK